MNEWETQFVRRLFSNFFDRNAGPYYLSNLYDLFYQNLANFNSGDWFGEFIIALDALLKEFSPNGFCSNKGRYYLPVGNRPDGGQYFAFKEVPADEYWTRQPTSKYEPVPLNEK